MFITKKKLNILIEEEKAKIYEREHLYRVEEEMRKGLARLEQRVYKLEHPDEKENKPVNEIAHSFY